MLRSRSAGVLSVVALALAVAGCGGGSSAGGGSRVELALVAYSTPQAAYEALIKAFQKTPEGKNVTFTKSFGGSGDQSRAVEAGLKADVVAFSLEPDMTRLVKKGLVAEDWTSQGDKGNVSYSVVALATRKGNVMIAYENEAIYAQQQKQPIDYVIPDSTILIQNPVAVTKTSAHPTEANAFLKFLFGKEGQQIFVDQG